MKFYLNLAVTVALSSWLSAQKISLKWDKPITEDFGTEVKILPHFTNDAAVYDAGNIALFMSYKTDSHNLQITDLEWVQVPQKELYGLSINNIPQENQTGISYSTNAEASFASIRVATFKRDRDKVYRLQSFNISEKNASTNRLSSVSSKIGTTENPLKDGKFYKIRVDKSGVFKITAKFLKDNGISLGSINPKNLRIYGNGGLMLPEFNQDQRYSALQENAIEVKGEADGVWNDDDYALFYAQGPNGYNLYDNANGNAKKRTETRNDRSQNFQNIYEDYSYYFLTFDKGAGKRIAVKDEVMPADVQTEFDEYQVVNEEKNNLLEIGRIWAGDAFTKSTSVNFKINTPLVAGTPVRYAARVIAYKAQGTSIKMSLNGTEYGAATIAPKAEDYVLQKFNDYTETLSGSDINFTFDPNIAGNPNATFFLDYAEVQYRQPLRYNDGQMNFRNFNANIPGKTFAFAMANAANVEEVWDVSYITNVIRRPNKTSGGTFTFAYTPQEQFASEFVAFKQSAAFTPQFVSRIDNQDISSSSAVQYLIISNKNLLGEATRIADYYKDKYSVLTVTDEQIYNEYSSGSKDVTAIRDYITKLFPGGLKYVLIVGDASYDFRNKSGKTGYTVLSYQSEDSGSFVNSFVTDDYFVMATQQTDTHLSNTMPDLPIGRLPAQTAAEAKLLVDKTLAYYNALPAQPSQSSPFGIWRMKLDFVADDDQDGGTPFHKVVEDIIKANFEGQQINSQGTYTTVPIDKPEYNVRKLYLDAYPAEITAGGQRYPQINDAIRSDVGSSLYLFYFGHGGINGWAQERVLTPSDISTFRNFNAISARFPLVSTITCEFTLWDNHNVYSAGEQFLKLKEGGAAAMITSSRALGVSYGEKFSQNFTKEIFKLNNDDFRTLGEAHFVAKKNYGNDANHLKVNFLGDPAMKLSRPQKLLAIDDVTPAGQLKALDKVKITGHINKTDGSPDNTFTGKVALYIYDKPVTKKTLNNDKAFPIMEFKEEGGPIVKAAGEAKNGTFTVEFYMPKDINYEIGSGRILAYADNGKFDVFENKVQTIGGINDQALNDNAPPKVNLYMNNTNFADGGITGPNPILLACLTDDFGINSTGAGVGHDITVILDGEVINTVVLNDYFTAGQTNGCVAGELADYQKGAVSYPFKDLKPGKHQLTFKVWDINNNSTTSTLNFTVTDDNGGNLVIKRPMNWPNPFTDKTYFQFEHNCDDALDVNVQIYTITGRLVKTISQQVASDGFMTGYRIPRTAIGWDGKDDYGDAAGKGTYIYKIFAKGQNQDKCKGSATAVEKLVLLR